VWHGGGKTPKCSGGKTPSVYGRENSIAISIDYLWHAGGKTPKMLPYMVK